jgi:hypothetical protein
METVIRGLESELQQAMLDSDVVLLAQLLADELVFTNHLGQRLSKQADLAAHASGLLKFTQLIPSEQAIVAYESFAVVSVVMHAAGVYANEAFSAKLRYTRIWARTTASWHLVAGHSSLVQESAVT